MNPAVSRRPVDRWRAGLGDWITSPGVQHAITALILVNAVTLGLETSAAVMAVAGDYLVLADRVILTVFVLELVAKLAAFGRRFFTDPWNIFDLLVVGIALVPASGPLAVLRTLRVLRVLRLISTIPRLRLVVEALLRAIPGLGAIGGLMAIIFYVGGVMATGLFGGAFPEWFGSVGRSMYTLFQVMTLESWSMGIARPVMAEYPHAWAFFVPFILISTFTMLNLFIGIIVNTMQNLQEQGTVEIEHTVHADTRLVLAELHRLRDELAELRAGVAGPRQ